MKKIFISILVLISVQSFGQNVKKYAERLNSDGTIDSMYIKLQGDSIFLYSNNNFVARTREYYSQFFNPIIPGGFANYILCADGIYRNVPNHIEQGSYTPTLFNTTNVAASTAYECGWLRVGNRVTVYGLVDIDVTSAAATVL